MEDIIIKKFKDVTTSEKDGTASLFGFAVRYYLYENNLDILNEKVADKTVIGGIITAETAEPEIDVFITTSMAFEASIILFDILFRAIETLLRLSLLEESVFSLWIYVQ